MRLSWKDGADLRPWLAQPFEPLFMDELRDEFERARKRRGRGQLVEVNLCVQGQCELESVEKRKADPLYAWSAPDTHLA